ncbi:hypothetical protein [Leptospira licerasiae]|uniref:hypothetical protein n=1 Tax=Leptospira licerasiae TaxID=447106 RepID=UPI003016DE3F
MLEDFFTIENTEIESDIFENFDSVNLKIRQYKNSLILDLFGRLSSISDRDTFELLVDIKGNVTSVENTSVESKEKLSKHINDNDDYLDCSVELKIKKNKLNNVLSIYFLSSLFSHLSHENPENVIKDISEYANPWVLFEVFSSISNFNTESLYFYQYKIRPDHFVSPNIDARNSKLNLFHENSNHLGMAIRQTPGDFYLIVESGNVEIDKFFRKMSAILSLIYLANSSEFNNQGRLSFKLNGYKTITAKDVEGAEIIDFYKMMFKIYAWAYEGGNSSDKLGLVRNVLSLHANENNEIKFDSIIWDALQSNYQIYLKGNVQSYLEIKNKISEFVIDATNKTYSSADEIIDSFKNNVFILLTFLLSVVVVNSFKEKTVESVFSKEYLIIVGIISVISMLWLLMLDFELLKRFNSSSDTMKRILCANYKHLLLESEIHQAVDPIIEMNRDYIRGQVTRYSFWWVALIIAFFSSFLIGYFILQAPGEVDTPPYVLVYLGEWLFQIIENL